MVRYSILSAMALLSVSSPAALSAQAATTAVVKIADQTSQAENLRFRTDISDRMTVPVVVSGSGPYHFLVDTGANRTTISHQLATHLNLPSGRTATLHSIAGVSSTSTAIVPTIQLTRKPVRSVETPLLESEHMGADGILGTDMLASQRVIFDFAKQTMSVVPAATRHFDPPGTIVIEGRRRNGRLIVTDATANGRPLTVVVDTGAEVSIGNEALRRALMKKGIAANMHPIELVSVTGEKVVGEYLFIRQFELGGAVLTDLAVIFAPAHTFDQLRINDRPAVLLGMNAMRSFRQVSIDFASRTMRVSMPGDSQSGMEASRNGSGLMGGRL